MNVNKQNQNHPYMITFNEAINYIREQSTLLASEEISTLNASGRVLAEAIDSPSALPPFNNSAMDGFSVRSELFTNATEDSPIKLEIKEIRAAGEVQAANSNKDSDNGQNQVTKIMTGAIVPDWADAVVPIENVEIENDFAIFTQPVKNGSNIRKAGEDIKLNEKVADKGAIVDSNLLSFLHVLGITKVKVFKRPSVALFSTGKELVDDLAKPLKAGQIRNSNKPFILDWLKKLPVECKDWGTNHDDTEKFEFDLKMALQSKVNIVITTGAVSMGDFDFIPKTVQSLDGEIIFHKIQMKPGKPILFARFPNGTFFFGLPGNPVSTNVGLRFFVSSLILAMHGKQKENPISGLLTNQYQKKKGFRHILKAKSKIDSKGVNQINLLDGQESFKLKPLLEANGWAMIEEADECVQASHRIDFYPHKLNWPSE